MTLPPGSGHILPISISVAHDTERVCRHFLGFISDQINVKSQLGVQEHFRYILKFFVGLLGFHMDQIKQL